MTLKISIALCTYNGQAFLAGQLQSIRNQTRQPDEMIVCDDGSTDQTIELLDAFAKTALFPVHISKNPGRLGPAQNFSQAIDRCTGQIICLCDQDDLWAVEKLASIERCFTKDPDLAFVFSDARMIDAAGQPLGYTLWSSVGFAGSLRRRFDAGESFSVLLRQNVVTGAALAFAASYRSLVQPIDGLWMHDGWIALLLAAVSKARAIDEELIEYRQHTGQSIGAAWRSLYQQYQNARQMDRLVFADLANQYQAALARLQEQTDFAVPTGVVPALQQKIAHCRLRSRIRERKAFRLRAIPEWLAGRYSQFSLGWKSVAQDLFL